MVARAEYDFTASSEEEISLQAGDMLNLAPKGKIMLFCMHVIINQSHTLFFKIFYIWLMSSSHFQKSVLSMLLTDL